ncbi:hypothetical protein HanPI659440_Chr03g0100881 [Helianthus annuus]|uniref:Transmembrane protein n=1 Tax=Helianthus annuus TaxID=4232 RepID=A0A251V853_HELAN|nr:uncharacterized protein LOC110929085 [Helianthus annuus]KAF5813152.1 hypothetical protein HanXRQr2_Chr03g0094871 [Helianthus annuus]KAJ0591956.1 hypothetical protein HanHA300_Chr03g0079281 [Helianthus annuus]KAJ0599330.1 hypothetical protein HanIR_Chr03g0103631 [Helianthus annuus]KAJ0606927.1 hypothetical protein HanHA89_Chr03g0090631 [Helianthus annuus]KAJ0766993.1 hypothetical protein HanLR1_Chr03g0083951 [Helianthus annuus]
MNMSKLSGFLELLKAPLKILSQNGKLMAITATVYLILYSISFILYMLSANPFILDLTHKLIALASARPGTPDFSKLLVAIREDTGIFLGIEVAYFVLFFFVALFAQTAVVITASCYYSGHDLSLKELFLKVSKTWTRPFVTSLWIQLLSLGYTSFFLLPFLVPSLVLFDHRTILITVLIFLAIFFILIYIYLSVVWSLAFVVSVVEDSYGYSALGKAKVLVNGKRVHGFLLNFFLNLVTLVIIVTGSKLMKLSPAMPIVVGVIQVLLIGIISMFKSIAYCEFYVQCKNNMTKLGGLDYSRIPTTPVVDEYLP